MSFFKRLSSFIAGIGFLFLLLTVVFFSFTALDNKPTNRLDVKISFDYQAIYLKEDVDFLTYHEDNNTIYLNVSFKKSHDKNYYLSYAYYYFDKYNRSIHLITEDEKTSYVITINNDGIASIVG